MERIEINRGWTFQKLDGSESVTVDLPHTWYKDDDQYRGEAVYKKTVEVPAAPCLILELGAADHTVRAYVSGVELGVHKGGYSRVRFEIPRSCVREGKIELELYVDNSPVPDVSPLAGDFTVFGGLTRGVSLLCGGENHFDRCWHGTDGIIIRASVNEDGDGILNLEPHTYVRGEAHIRYTLNGPEGEIETFHGPVDVAVRHTVRAPRLWDGTRDPALYTLRAELVAGDEVADVTELRTGFRMIRVDPDRDFSSTAGAFV